MYLFAAEDAIRGAQGSRGHGVVYEGQVEAGHVRSRRVRLKAKCIMDATAGIAIGSRRGLGRVRHIDTMFLWVQDLVSRGVLKIAKRHTSDMLADVLTKSVPEATMQEMLRRMGYEYRQGEHQLALKA